MRLLPAGSCLLGRLCGLREQAVLARAHGTGHGDPCDSIERRPYFAPLFLQGRSEPNQSWTRWSAFGPFRDSKGSGARAL